MTWLYSQYIMRISWFAAMNSLVFLFVFAFTSPTFATEPREFILSNGMKALLVEVPKAPVATV
jgi:zinc protease